MRLDVLPRVSSGNWLFMRVRSSLALREPPQYPAPQWHVIRAFPAAHNERRAGSPHLACLDFGEMGALPIMCDHLPSAVRRIKLSIGFLSQPNSTATRVAANHQIALVGS
jgi:hypothetical protein